MADTNAENPQTAVPTTSAQTVVPTTLTQTVVPTTLAQTVVPTTAAQTVVPTTASQTVLPTTAAQTVVPTTAAQTVVPTTAAQTVVPTTAVTNTGSAPNTNVPATNTGSAPDNNVPATKKCSIDDSCAGCMFNGNGSKLNGEMCQWKESANECRLKDDSTHCQASSGSPNCDVCAVDFDKAGGCDLMRAGKDTFSAVPQGCDACGEEALAYCSKNNPTAPGTNVPPTNSTTCLETLKQSTIFKSMQQSCTAISQGTQLQKDGFCKTDNTVVAKGMAPTCTGSVTGSDICPNACTQQTDLAKEKVDLTLNVDGVTEANKDNVCQSVAEKLGGTVEQCNLGASAARLSEERMLAPAELKVRVAVKSAEAAKAQTQTAGFASTIVTNDSSITVSSVSAVTATVAPAGNPQTTVPTTAAQTANPTTAVTKDCDVCAVDFDKAGGCDLMRAGKDTFSAVPQGCDACGEQALAYCTKKTAVRKASAAEQVSSFVLTTLTLVVMISYF